MKTNRSLSLLILAGLILSLLVLTSCQGERSSSTLPAPPISDKQIVTDVYHSVEVSEEYRWLENFDDPTVKNWNRTQNSYTREYLDNIKEREQIKEVLSQLLGGESTDYYSLKYQDGTLFAMKFQPPKEQPLLVKLNSVDDLSTEQVILDVGELNPDGTTSIDFYVPSLDGRLVAVSLSEKGSELGDVHIFDVASGVELGDVVTRVNGPTAGGDVSWVADGSGFYYTRYPHEGELPEEDLSFYQQVYYHKLGTAVDKDTYVIGKEFPRIAEIQLESSDDGHLAIATVANGDGGEYAHYLKNKKGKWTQLTHFDDLIRTVTFGPDNSLYLLSHKDTPMGRILRLSAGKTDISLAKTIVEESDVSIRSFLPTDNYLIVVDMAGGPITMRTINLNNKEVKTVPTQPNSYSGRLVNTGGDVVLFRTSSYVTPPVWFRFNVDKWEVKRTALFKTSPADFSDIEVVREFAVSDDGTRVPVNILYPKGLQLNSNNPTILYGYGGYGISLSPSFNPDLRLWFDQGGVYAVANLRGGGEYGEEWHLAGNLTKKQNVFDDFAACARHLIQRCYTNSSKLVIKGGSNGGLLMGAAFTQHPELFAAVVSYVGIYDMLRVELDPNGEFNITEFGTVEDPDHFQALHAYSPYHNVKDNTAYPAIMFLAGEHDGRVNPYQSRKMTARMQTATNSDKPVLLRTSARAGHGGGTALSDRIEREADVYSFIIDQLDIGFKHDQ